MSSLHLPGTQDAASAASGGSGHWLTVPETQDAASAASGGSGHVLTAPRDAASAASLRSMCIPGAPSLSRCCSGGSAGVGSEQDYVFAAGLSCRHSMVAEPWRYLLR